MGVDFQFRRFFPTKVAHIGHLFNKKTVRLSISRTYVKRYFEILNTTILKLASYKVLDIDELVLWYIHYKLS